MSTSSTSEGLTGLANGIEKSLAAYGYVTLSNDDWKDVVSALRLAATPKAGVDREVIARQEPGIFAQRVIAACRRYMSTYDFLADEIRLDMQTRMADAIRASDALLPSVLGGVAWQPIETAPQDATEIIGLLRPKVIRLVWWFAPSSRSQGWRDENSNLVKPTHWMPLPDNAGLVSGGGK